MILNKMFFKKKGKKKEVECQNCGRGAESKHKFCPYCANPLIDMAEEKERFGMLGTDDFSDEEIIRQHSPAAPVGMDKVFSSLVNNIMKSLNAELQEDGGAEIRTSPNSIKIMIGGSQPRQRQRKTVAKRELSDEQVKRMSGLPRKSAKTTIRRLADRVVYELNTPGVDSTNDIFISKLESGYEIKAIGKDKVYVNSLPISLPLHNLSLEEEKLVVEFKTGN